METKFDSNVMKLEKEIFDISKNINKFKTKNHKTMLNMMEKIKSFSKEIKTNNKSNIDTNKKKLSSESKRKMLIKSYQNLSKTNISEATPSNKQYQYQNNEIPINFKEKKTYNNNINKINNSINYYSNKNLIKKKEKQNYLSNMSYNSAKSNTNLDLNDNYNNNIGRNTCNEHINKYFSYNFDYSNNYSIENDNDIKQRINSLNNIKINNTNKKNFSNNDSKNESKYKKDFKNENKKYIKKVNSYQKKDFPKRLIKNIKFIINNQNNNKKEIKNIKREHCNINISEYYKNINNKEINQKKKNGKMKIINHKKLKNFPSGINNMKLDKKYIINDNNYPNSSRNNVYSKIHNSTYNNKSNNNNNSISEKNRKNYYNAVCPTFNPFYNNNNNNYKESSYEDSIFKGTKKTVNTFREEKIHKNKNSLLMNGNSNKIKNLKQYQYYNNIGRKSYEYYYGNEENKNMREDTNDDINLKKHKLIKNNNNYSKDFIDIITNKNNDNYKYDYVSIYNNLINQKKENCPNSNNNFMDFNEEKYKNLLSKLKCKNFDEIFNKIDKLLNYEIFINKIYSLYDKNNNFYSYNEKNLKNIYSWIELNIELNKKYKDEIKRYQNFCGKLMEEFNYDGFDKFKNDIMETVYKNKIFGMNKFNSISNSEYNNQIYQNKDKENISINSQIYGGDSKIKNNSYSNLGIISDIKNGEEITLRNLKFN